MECYLIEKSEISFFFFLGFESFAKNFSSETFTDVGNCEFALFELFAFSKWIRGGNWLVFWTSVVN